MEKTTGLDYNSIHQIEYRQDGKLAGLITFTEIFNQTPTPDGKIKYGWTFYHIGNFTAKGSIHLNPEDNVLKILLELIPEIRKKINW